MSFIFEKIRTSSQIFRNLIKFLLQIFPVIFISFISHTKVHLMYYIYQNLSHSFCLPQSISCIHLMIIHVIHIYPVWLHIVNKPYCHFHLSANSVSRNQECLQIKFQCKVFNALLEGELRWFYYSFFHYKNRSMVPV